MCLNFNHLSTESHSCTQPSVLSLVFGAGNSSDFFPTMNYQLDCILQYYVAVPTSITISAIRKFRSEYDLKKEVNLAGDLFTRINSVPLVIIRN